MRMTVLCAVAFAGFLQGAFGTEIGDAVFSPAYFWMWNGRLDAKELCAQLEDMHAHGLRNVCIHPFPKGFRDWFATEMEPDYLTALDATDHSPVRTARSPPTSIRAKAATG